MRQAITTLLLVALTVSAVGQLSPETCPMQSSPKPVLHAESSAVPPCHANRMPSYRQPARCVLTHTCCGIAPAEAQLLLSRWILVAPVTDAAVPHSLAVRSLEPRGDVHAFAETVGARPPVEKLKTDLRI
jgi:hypothetical protein